MIIISVFLLFSATSFSQDRFAVLDSQLTTLSKTVPGIIGKVEVSVNGVSIQQFINGIAIANNLDISIDPTLSINVVNSFSSATVKDILLFLCKQYDLDITFIGNIINIEKFKATIVEKKEPVIVKKVDITYNNDNKTVSYDLKSDSLFLVVKELTKATGKNFVIPPDLFKKTVSGYIKDMSVDNALDMLAYSNNININKSGDNYLFETITTESTTTDNTAKKTTNTKSSLSSKSSKKAEIPDEVTTFSIDSLQQITIKAVDTPILDIIKEVSKKMNISYFISSAITGNVTVNLINISYDELLNNILNGTEFTYKINEENYIFGKRDMEGLRETRVVKLNYRSVDKVSTYIPADIKKDVEVKEFPELNSIILSGSKRAIDEVDSFLFSIDKVVPVILIEVLIVESKTSYSVSTGLAATLKADNSTPVTTNGNLFPTADVTVNSNTINDIINSINGFGWINLGKVTSKFFVSLQAMEDQGIIKVNSTPKLATLNGNEATLSIGNTEYYLEETSNLIANQSTQNITTKQYKSVNADLTLTIKPFVSGDNQITLNIEVDQSDFTARISPNAPPGSVTRSFSSLIRVKNEEMVLLGGLEKKSNSSSGSGVPILARIPVIKWFFSSQTKEKSKSKLNIFIKPTIVY